MIWFYVSFQQKRLILTCKIPINSIYHNLVWLLCLREWAPVLHWQVVLSSSAAFLVKDPQEPGGGLGDLFQQRWRLPGFMSCSVCVIIWVCVCFMKSSTPYTGRGRAPKAVMNGLWNGSVSECERPGQACTKVQVEHLWCMCAWPLALCLFL